MAELTYKFFRMLFGVILCLIALKSITDPNQMKTLSNLMTENIKGYHNEEGHIIFFDLPYISEESNKILRSKINLSDISSNAEETVKFIYALLFIGGLMCALGEPFSKCIIISSLVLDIFLIHNLRFFVTDSGKGTMLKYIAYIGGAMYVV